ncbi:60 kDa inner membrane insertion protein [Parvibaculum lavamentivorans DS-1]|uniref:Membrane protein insertase YidC n=1 Tax=Parvibaculum lavamentivorans (strain DS-1 / DSM 13023 / NCIMB 13966) TaxID=402881 RepID=A7HPT9_PARL1|nr:membrane protein insertase YidC [Parvibaculum lavamentivorans]ABS61922.1 60 kDa inner membrane insertion protein [Parvibaculum lavamentivorans DS-1]
MGDNRNFIIAIFLSVLVFIGWQYFFIEPQMEAERARQEQLAADNGTAEPAPGAAPSAPGDARLPSVDAPATRAPGVAASGAVARDEALAQSARVPILSEELQGSVSLRGARFDDLKLLKYNVTVDPESPEVELFSPVRTERPYFSEFGFIAAPGANINLPTSATEWELEAGDRLTPQTPVTLRWDNGQGLVFHREIALDEHFLFTVTDRIENLSANEVTLYPYGLISRTGRPAGSSFFILHEGFIGEFPSVGEKAITYDDAEEDDPVQVTDTEGWLGITDKYWAAALVPQSGLNFVANFSEHPDPAIVNYQADFRYGAQTVPAGGSITLNNRLFAGAKVSTVIDSYRDAGIYKFSLLIDWGWFWFLTQPMFDALHFIALHVGNFGIAILVITVLIKLVFYPLANKSYVAMSKMKKLQPEMEKLRERYKDDKLKQQQEIMELYKKEKVNPLAGCLPVLIQIPVFFALYKVLFVTIEMRHAPFFGWINDLSAPDPTSIFNLFGLIPWDPPSMLMIGIWPLIMGFTMFVQQRMNPLPADPIQAQIFTWMPVIFTFMLASFPAGLVIYWAWNNTLSVIQQGVIMKRQGVKIEIFSNLGLEKLAGVFSGNKPKS